MLPSELPTADYRRIFRSYRCQATTVSGCHVRGKVDDNFLMEQAVRWRQWANLAASDAERSAREAMAQYYEGLASEKGAVPLVRSSGATS